MIVLASASEWRAKLLKQWGFSFDIRPTHVDETYENNTHTDPKTLVETLASKKYTACPRHHSQEIIIAADTVIWIDNQIIGKPKDRIDAKRIITLLHGNTHQVWTGICLNNRTFSDVASVTFAPMTDDQIEMYLDTNDWIGKAGAYQIQKAIKPFVQSINGDINTIIGLPSQIKSLLV